MAHALMRKGPPEQLAMMVMRAPWGMRATVMEPVGEAPSIAAIPMIALWIVATL